MIGFVLITALFLRRGETPLLALIKENPTGQIYLFTCVVFSSQGLLGALAVLELFVGVASNWKIGLPQPSKCRIKGVHTHTQLQQHKFKLQKLKVYLWDGLVLFAFQVSLDETLG